MGHILHDWDLDEKRLLLRKAYDALPDGGALIVYDAIIDDERRENAFGLLMSLNMLIETPGGFDYTGGRLPQLDGGGRLPRELRRAPRRARLDGGGDQIAGRRAAAWSRRPRGRTALPPSRSPKSARTRREAFPHRPRGGFAVGCAQVGHGVRAYARRAPRSETRHGTAHGPATARPGLHGG